MSTYVPGGGSWYSHGTNWRQSQNRALLRGTRVVEEQQVPRTRACILNFSLWDDTETVPWAQVHLLSRCARSRARDALSVVDKLSTLFLQRFVAFHFLQKLELTVYYCQY